MLFGLVVFYTLVCIAIGWELHGMLIERDKKESE